MLQDSWLLKPSSTQASLKKEMKMEVLVSSATSQYKIVMLILEKIFTKTLFFLEELLFTRGYQIDFKRNWMQCAHKPIWLKLLLLQTDITLYGQVVQLFAHSQHLKANGLLKKNMKKTVQRLFIENVYEDIDTQYFIEINLII